VFNGRTVIVEMVNYKQVKALTNENSKSFNGLCLKHHKFCHYTDK